MLYEGLKSQPLADALMVCHGRIEKYRLMEASEEASSA
ncbi:hypothetical protein CGBL_0111280 [Corynebacterium glutamicum]|nr:hypothetical protein CGBL_0111280 [Corynebacterium glutamicum]